MFHMQYSVENVKSYTQYFPTSNAFVKYQFEDGNCYIDDVLKLTDNTFAYWDVVHQENYRFGVFAINRDGTYRTFIDNSDIRIKYMRFYKNGKDVCNLIPCYRKNDSKPGLYDIVGRKFYTNVGTGEFEVGPDVINE